MSSPLTPAQLAALINDSITANGVGAITGPVLNNTLQQVVDLLALAFTLPEPLTVTGTNTLSALSNTPSSTMMFLYVNGRAFFSGSPSPAFTFSGTTVSWSATNAKFSLATTDTVFAHYSY